jgi:thiosulfate reductase cytochrome b subunit
MAVRHPLLVRVTHWAAAASFVGLAVSGIAILLAHPRFYWGEVGVVGMPSLFDLPLPFVLTGQTGWGRSLHFLAAWAMVMTGTVYMAAGARRGHFRWPFYTPIQRRVYRAVIFGVVPLMIWTGLAMSPALTSVFPPMVQLLGGHQSARTIHFVMAIVLTSFVLGHIIMVAATGFIPHVAAMITGDLPERKEAVWAGRSAGAGSCATGWGWRPVRPDWSRRRSWPHATASFRPITAACSASARH